MSHFKASVLLSAPAADVYMALTTQRGVSAWWTTDCEVGTGIGDSVTVRFGDTFKVMRIESLRPWSEVAWRVVDAHLAVPGLTRTSEWVGTTIRFSLSQESGTTTRLDLEHVGLTEAIECYGICTQGWHQFLASLKSCVETGVGAPFAPEVV